MNPNKRINPTNKERLRYARIMELSNSLRSATELREEIEHRINSGRESIFSMDGLEDSLEDAIHAEEDLTLALQQAESAVVMHE